MLFSEEQWAELRPILPHYKLSPKGGRPRLKKRKIFEGILFVFKNKIPWKGAPKEYGSGTALNDYFREWAKTGVFHRLKEKYPYQFLYLDWEKINSLNSQNHKQIPGGLYGSNV